MRLVLFASAVLVVGCKKSGSLDWERDPSAAADTLFEGYLASTGGLEASLAIQNLRIEATTTIPAQGLSMGMVIWEERPDRSRMEVRVPMLGVSTSGYADGVAWEVSPMTGARIKEGKEAEEARRSGRIDLFERWREEYPERAVKGIVDFASVSCFQVDVVTSLGKPETMYFSRADGRLMGTEAVVTMDMGEVKVVNEVLEYQDVDGVAMATLTRQTMGAMVMETRFVDLKTNLPDFPDLTPPPEILALAAEE